MLGVLRHVFELAANAVEVVAAALAVDSIEDMAGQDVVLVFRPILESLDDEEDRPQGQRQADELDGALDIAMAE